MKKVRYVIGTAGILGAAPALGLLMPAANADAGTHAPATGHTGKTVSLRPMTTTAAAPALTTSTSSSWVPDAASAPAPTSRSILIIPDARTCTVNGKTSASAGTGPNRFIAWARYHSETHCLVKTSGILSHSQVGLLMRTRVYNGTKRVDQRYVHGHIVPNTVTSFYLSPLDITATKACEALVYSTDKTRVAYGPVCEKVH